MAAVYSRLDSDLAPGHNDLFKPDNMLFDGNRLWLVDWEAAFQNDRYADLAVVANMIVTNESEERIYLQEYFGEAPDEYQRARFYLIRQLAHMFYAMAFLTLGSSGKPIDRSEPVPAYSDFQRRFWAREVSLADNQAKTVYGRVHWEQLSQNMRQARFDEALRIVAPRGLGAEPAEHVGVGLDAYGDCVFFIEAQAEPLEHGDADIAASGEVLEHTLAAAAVAVFVEDYARVELQMDGRGV